MPAVSWRRNCRPCQSRSTAMASRVMPASGAGEQPLLAEQPVDQRRLAGIRPADHGDADRAGAAVRPPLRPSRRLRGRFRQRGAQRVVEIGQALAVLGRDRDRLAETERIGFEPAAPRPRVPSLLLATRIDRLAGLAHQIGEGAVGRRQVRRARRSRRRSHRPARSRPRSAPACGRTEFPAPPPPSPAVSITVKSRSPRRRLALAAVAGDARRVVDQRQPPADQPVEQRRLADIRPADDGDGEAHEPRSRSPTTGVLRTPAIAAQRDTGAGRRRRRPGRVVLTAVRPGRLRLLRRLVLRRPWRRLLRAGGGLRRRLDADLRRRAAAPSPACAACGLALRLGLRRRFDRRGLGFGLARRRHPVAGIGLAAGGRVSRRRRRRRLIALHQFRRHALRARPARPPGTAPCVRPAASSCSLRPKTSSLSDRNSRSRRASRPATQQHGEHGKAMHAAHRGSFSSCRWRRSAPSASRCGPRVPGGVSASAAIMSIQRVAAAVSWARQADSASSSRAVWRKVRVRLGQRLKPALHFA